VATLHEFPTFRFRRRLRVGVALAACDLLIAPDPEVVRSIRRQLWWRPGLTTRLIPLAANIWPSEAGRLPETSPVDRDLIVGYWGFLRPDKGAELLLEAFAKVRKSRPARLILAGDPGAETQYISGLVQLAEHLGVADSIETTGKLTSDELSAALSSFDVCCLPFRDGLTENRGTYAGSVAHGLYIATTSRTRTGYDAAANTSFVRPGDRDALAAAILQAPAHPRRPGTVTSAGAWGEIADAHLAAYARTGR
jgi:glycosyltransferase involved in cell wall biosynthesis